MKKVIFISIFALCTLNFALSQQYGWIDLGANIPDSNTVQKNLRDVCFIGQEGWIAGQYNEAKVYYTPDGGLTFTSQSFPANSGQACQSVFMRTPQDGYAVTNTGHILKTTDGGTNWSTIGTGMGLLYSISFPPLPEPSGYVSSGNGWVYKITGSTIVQELHLIGASFYSICFPQNSDEGWVCGGATIRHRNSSGWIIGDQNYSTGYSYNAIHFIDNQHGWAVGNQVIIRTLNGIDWFGVTNSYNYSYNDVCFVSTQEGWIVGNKILLHSTDGGLTWIKEAENLTDSAFLKSVFAVNNHEVYVTGQKNLGNNQYRSVLLKYTQITGIGERPAVGFNVFPNPTSGKFQISSDKFQVQRVEIVDLYGNKVDDIKGIFGADGMEFDISHLTAGMYFIKITCNNFSVTKKLMKLK